MRMKLLNLARWRLTFVNPEHETCCMSPFWRYNSVAPSVSGKSMKPCLTSYHIWHGKNQILSHARDETDVDLLAHGIRDCPRVTEHKPNFSSPQISVLPDVHSYPGNNTARHTSILTRHNISVGSDYCCIWQ